MNKSPRDPKCEQQKQACASYADGFCTILTDTNFGRRECPFFRQRKGAVKKE